MMTAKVILQGKVYSGDEGDRRAALTFQPDYADGRNQEWAVATPALSLNMTVKAELADRLEVGQRYTLKFEPND